MPAIYFGLIVLGELQPLDKFNSTLKEILNYLESHKKGLHFT